MYLHCHLKTLSYNRFKRIPRIRLRVIDENSTHLDLEQFLKKYRYTVDSEYGIVGSYVLFRVGLHNKDRDGFEDSMFEAKASSLRGQGQGQLS